MNITGHEHSAQPGFSPDIRVTLKPAFLALAIAGALVGAIGGVPGLALATLLAALLILALADVAWALESWRSIVTDLRQDYGSVIAQVFPQAAHHECIFHASQQAQQHVKDAYGPDYADHHPEAAQLKQQIYRIFAAETLDWATERYLAVLALRQDYVQARPEADAIFDFLECHWLRLANSIGSDLIPATNNTVERIIGRFDQHYPNLCGFESIADAQCYLAVFEKIYRFTPFSQDAQPGVRGKCPLQLAGYDISRLPVTTLCAGLSIVWPVHTQEVACVPSP